LVNSADYQISWIKEPRDFDPFSALTERSRFLSGDKNVSLFNQNKPHLADWISAAHHDKECFFNNTFGLLCISSI